MSMVFRRAEMVIVLGRDMARVIEDRYCVSNKVCVINNWAELDLVQPMPRKENKLLNGLGLDRKFVVLYAGNIGRTHGIEYLAQAAQRLANQPEIHFLVVGFGAKRQWLEDFVQTSGLTNVTLIPPQARSEQGTFLNAGDVALISFVQGMAGISVPSRMYSQMAAGKPIIAMADDWSELALVVSEERIGWVVAPGDIEGLVRTIAEAAGSRLLVGEMGARAAQVAQRKYSFEKSAQAYVRLFDNLCQSSAIVRVSQ